MLDMSKVKINLSGVRAVLSDPGVVADCERRAKAIADSANDAALEHYKYLGYKQGQELFVTKTTRTAKYDLPEVVVFANPGIHSGPADDPGPPIGDYAQAHHNVLTNALDAGRS